MTGTVRQNRLVVLWALLLALAWQSFVTQTHVHWAAASTQLTAIASPSTPDDSSPYDLPANCPICREVATSGVAMLPAPVVIAVPMPAEAFAAAVSDAPAPVGTRSHRWRSRAPPIQFQA